MQVERSRSGGFLAGIARLLLLLLSAAFVVALVAVGLVLIMLSVVWSLLRGRKPTVVKIYTQFSEASRRFRSGNFGFQAPPTDRSSSEVVDVDAHEVDAARLK